MKINPIELNETSFVNTLAKQKQSCHSTTIPSTPSTTSLAGSVTSPNLLKQTGSSPTSNLFNNESTRAKGKSNYLDIFSYHDKISELLNETTSDYRTKRNTKLDRRSFYDNQDTGKLNESKTHSNDIELLLVEEDASSLNHYTMFKSEKNIQINSSDTDDSKKCSIKHERDDFDDLVDMTHRIPNKKVTQNHGHNYHHQQHPHHNTISIGSLKSKTRASLPPLPPLPYSFVKIENNKNNFKNSNDTQQNSPSSSFNSSSNSSSTHLPKTTTRLIIPHSSPPNGDTNATPQFRHQFKQQQQNSKVLRESTPNINNRQEINQLKISGGISQSNFRKSAPLSHTLQSASSIMNRKQSVCDSSPPPPLFQHNRQVHYSDSQKENTNSLSSNSKNSSFLESNSSQSSSNFGSSSSTNLKRISPENGPNIKYQSSRHKQNGVNQNGDVQQEWEQITKIFASLETLLNEVVESTSTKPSPRGTRQQSCNLEQNKHFNKNSSHKLAQGAQANTSRKSAYCTSSQHQLHSSLIKSASSMPYFNASMAQMTNAANRPSLDTTNSLQRSSAGTQTRTANLKSASRADRHQAALSTPGIPLFQITINNKSDKETSKKKRSSTTLAELENINNSSKNQTEINNFLKKINMSKYELKFISNGFDDINFLNNVITLQDLLQIGVESYDEAFKLLNEIKQLPSSIKSLASDNIKFFRVEDWLSYLNLNEYLDNFFNNKINSMKRIRQLWEIELTTILQISLLGHRRRMLASIDSNLKQKLDENKRHSSNQNYSGTVGKSGGLKITSVSSSPYNSVFSKTNNNPTNSLENLKNSISATSFYSSPIKSVKFADEMNEKSEQAVHVVTNAITVATLETNGNEKLNDIDQQGIVCCTNNSNQLPASNSSPILVDSIFDSTIEPIYSSYSSCLSKEDQRISPKTIWKNDPKLLIRSSCNFVVQYLGSSALTKMNPNQDPVKQTIDRLKNTSKSTPYQSPKVELGVSINGVKLLHHQTKDCLWNHDIKHINNVCQDQDDLNYFAFSTQTEPNAYYYCHVFSCKDKELSTQIILTIGQAFDLAYELFCKNNFN